MADAGTNQYFTSGSLFLEGSRQTALAYCKKHYAWHYNLCFISMRPTSQQPSILPKICYDDKTGILRIADGISCGI